MAMEDSAAAGEALTAKVDAFKYIGVPVLVALITYVGTHITSMWRDATTARLRRVNKQLRYLFGPLRTLGAANFHTMRGLVTQAYPDVTFAEGFASMLRDVQKDSASQLAKMYRHTVINQLQPRNKQLLLLCEENYHLLDSNELPEYFMQLAQHVAEFDYIITQWEASDFTLMHPKQSYPPTLTAQVQEETRRLKRLQSQLLGTSFASSDTECEIESQMVSEERGLMERFVHPSGIVQGKGIGAWRPLHEA